MRSYVVFVFLLAFSLISAGCVSSTTTLNPKVPAQADQADIPYHIEKKPFPSAVQEIISVVSQTGGVRAVTIQERTYLVIALGQRNTAGYSIEITSVEKLGDRIVVSFIEKKPGPGDMVAQVITYPYIVASIPKTTLPIEFVKQN